jgi:hypothetical protein
MKKIKIGGLSVSRLIIGGNPFSGFSHRSPDKDLEMKRYFTSTRIKETLKEAESLGIDTHIGRADHHVMRLLMEYWDEGGGIQWLAQTCPELGDPGRGIRNGIEGGAKACFIHGGQMDYFLAQNRMDEVAPAVSIIRETGLAAGLAGHRPSVFEWAEKNIDVDFYMCCYYNPTARDNHAEHITGSTELFNDADRDAMVKTIRNLSRPVIHYKVLASGRKTPEEAFEFTARHLRPQDAVCIGVYPGDDPGMLGRDVEIFSRIIGEAGE